MRGRQLALGLLLVILVLGTVACESISPPSPAKTPFGASGLLVSQQNTGIWVTGEGKVSVVPDIAVLSIGIEAQDTAVAKAQSQATSAMAAVMSALDSLAIAKKDIQTRHFSIVPVRRWAEDKREEILIGYRVTNAVTVKVRRVDNTGAVIDAVAKAGGDYTRINSVSFTVDNPTTYYQEARQKAMADAEAKAKQLASLGGVKLGKPIYINESGAYFPTPPPIPYRAEAMPVAPTPIMPGETEIRLSVQVVYRIE